MKCISAVTKISTRCIFHELPQWDDLKTGDLRMCVHGIRPSDVFFVVGLVHGDISGELRVSTNNDGLRLDRL